MTSTITQWERETPNFTLKDLENKVDQHGKVHVVAIPSIENSHEYEEDIKVGMMTIHDGDEGPIDMFDPEVDYKPNATMLTCDTNESETTAEVTKTDDGILRLLFSKDQFMFDENRERDHEVFVKLADENYLEDIDGCGIKVALFLGDIQIPKN